MFSLLALTGPAEAALPKSNRTGNGVVSLTVINTVETGKENLYFLLTHLSDSMSTEPPTLCKLKFTKTTQSFLTAPRF